MQRHETMDGTCKKSDNADAIWPFPDYADPAVSCLKLAVVRKGRLWRMGLPARIFLWTWRLCHGSMEAVLGSDEAGRKGIQPKTGFL